VADPTIDELVIAADEQPGREAGFAFAEGVAEVGSVRIRTAGADAGRRIVRWTLRDVASTDLDGLPTAVSEAPPAAGARQPNGVVRLDHVVAFTPDLDRSVAALERDGLPLRRVREGPTPGGAMRQAFFRLGEAILEVIENPPGTPERDDPDREARFYGIAFVAEDLDALAGELGDRLGSIRDAVQPGRRIATMRREANLGLPVAFMTPPA
jgi:catechol 2,3-dioxygenase-like lactoylglutathione lyase family enzyme